MTVKNQVLEINLNFFTNKFSINKILLLTILSTWVLSIFITPYKLVFIPSAYSCFSKFAILNLSISIYQFLNASSAERFSGLSTILFLSTSNCDRWVLGYKYKL